MSKNCIQEYSIQILPYMTRTFENNNITIVFAYILYKCSNTYNVNTGKHEWTRITYGDIYNYTRTNKSTAARCIKQLMNSGLLKKDYKSEEDNCFCYYMPNYALIHSLQEEDIHVGNILRNKDLPPTKKNFDKYARISKEIRRKVKIYK